MGRAAPAAAASDAPKSAPRFPAPAGSLAESAANPMTGMARALDTLSTRQFVDVTPFDGNPEDLAASAANMAGSVLLLATSAILINEDSNSDHGARGVHIAGALDAAFHLLALSDLARDLALYGPKRGEQ
ncbi:hypothetical protein [Sphingomonas sp. BK069]|uniref:hypothetical protein n=1 Tax=Sphingomonas sp. BK069 TaxID=2586979 RepID=UPI00161ED7E7|nr:hypothetical protein [Sphingomonas sp. BK069]MBB3347341.1 hypothetical protein [Sphingomonas sp. BK069]